MIGLTLLKNTHPELFKEWDFEKNVLSWETISTSSGRKVWWKCEKGHSWDAVVYSRTGKVERCGCRYCCHNAPPTTKRNFATEYPELLKEWDYDRNTVDPHTISPKNCKKRHWKCKYGHTWETRVAHRANGSSCPSCKGQSSKQQVFIYCEVRHFFPDAEYRKKIDGMECDIHLPTEKIGIEFDGLRYHKHKADVDATKINKLRDTGIEIVSIREYNLPLVNRLTVSYNKNCDDLEITKSLMTLLGRMLNRQDLIEYSLGNKQVGEQEYLKEMKTYPNSLGKTLANNNPELSMEWDYNNNGKLTPSDVAPYSHHIANWICPQGHLYKAIVSNRNLHKTGCPHCQNHSSLCYSDNKVREPLHPKRIRERKQSCKTYYLKRKELKNAKPT
jgi:hypothetical protein